MNNCQIKTTQDLGGKRINRRRHLSDKKLKKRGIYTDSDLIFVGTGKFREILSDWENNINSVSFRKREPEYFISGQTSKQTIENLFKSLKELPQIPFKIDNCKKEFIAGSISMEDQNILSQNFRFYDFQVPQLSVMEKIIEELKEPIQNYLESNFRIMNIRGIENFTHQKGFGPNRAHYDGGFPQGTHKVILYLTEANQNCGYTHVDEKGGGQLWGPNGFYIFFNPLQTRHWGVPPQQNYTKCIIEITLCPWKEIVLEPIAGGANSMFPVNV